jgi:hypothetical protein
VRPVVDSGARVTKPALAASIQRISAALNDCLLRSAVDRVASPTDWPQAQNV